MGAKSHMRLLATAGGLPTTIVENAAPWEWMGVLQLLSDPGQVRFIEVDGFGSNFFHASLQPMTGLIFVSPHARIDYEWFTAAGRAPVVDFNLRFFMTDGTVAQSASTFTVNVLDVDDTPPQALRFSSGGSVRAGMPGAVVGRLAVTDPDTPVGGHSFRLTEGDSWQFHMVGNELRLRPGIEVALADGPRRNIIIEVSDGRQSAAFQLSFDILPDPAVGTSPVSTLVPGLTKLGLEWVTPNGVGGPLPAWRLSEVGQAAGLVKVGTQAGNEVWFQRPAWIDFTSGFIEFSTMGQAARTWLAYETVFDRVPRLRETQSVVHDMVHRGLTEQYLLHWMLNLTAEGAPLRAMNSREFVREIYANAVSWTQPESTINFHASRIDNGIVTRVEFVQNIMNWRSQFNDFRNEALAGFYVPRTHMMEIGALYEVGMGVPMDGDAWWWFYMVDRGHLPMTTLARDIMGTGAYRNLWGGMSNAEFVGTFFNGLTGSTFPEADTRWWANALDAGSLSRADFMVAAVSNLPPTSPFHRLPAGPMFDAVW